jgi:oligopeptide/dipeptide ABC transporter ATP-binding protein
MLFAATPDLYGEDEVLSIPGAPPRLDRGIAGCPFQPRCDRSFDRCLSERPELIRLQTGHAAACHLNDSRTAAGSPA